MTQITITAASGRLGHALAAELAARGLTNRVRLAARTPQKIKDLQAAGFATVAADYEDPASLRAAFADTDVIGLIASEGDNATRFRHHRNAIDAAKAAGVRHIVFISCSNPSRNSLFELAASDEDSEAYLMQSGVAYTILRDNSYFTNNDALFDDALRTGTLFFPDIDAKVAYIAHEDVAGAMAGALINAGNESRVYEIAGREACSARELAAQLAEASGRPVEAIAVPLKAFADQFRALGLPEYMVTGLTSFYACLAAGEYARTSNDVERLSGRPSTPAREYLKRFVAAATPHADPI